MRSIEELINVAQFISDYLPRGKEQATGEISMNCPLHDEKHSSFSINPTTGLWKCYVPSCKGFNGGNLVQLVSQMECITTKEAYTKILQLCGVEKKPERIIPAELSEEKIQEYRMSLIAEQKVVDYLHNKYCYTAETIQRFKLGWNGTRLTIPIYDETGKLVNIRKKSLESGAMVGVEFFNQMRLFPVQSLAEEEIYLFEGEKDCILALQLGLNAITVTSGAGSFNQEWVPLFKDKKIIICYDIDAAGIAGAYRIKDILLNAVEELRIIKLPITTPPNGDFTDFILQGGDKEKFLELVNQAAAEPKLIHQVTRVPTFVHNTELGRAADAEFFFKRVRFNVIVSGKDTQPYLPPCKIDITCPSGQPFCKYCRMAMFGGKFTLELNELSQDILQWIDCTEEHHRALIQKNLEIPLKCKIWKMFTATAQTLEEVTLIPEISYAAHDTEYVVRTAYVLKKSVKSNCNYRFEAITMPHPNTQAATHLIYNIAENHTNIDEFKISEELCKELRIFCVG